MNAWIVSRQGLFSATEEELPPLHPQKIRIRVRYAGVGFADVMAAAGGYPLAPKAPFSPGYEFTGTIEAAGTRVAGAAIGTTVVGLLPHMNAYRDFIDVEPVWAIPVPAGVTEQAAALLPLNYLTAEAMLQIKAPLRSGQSLVIHGAAGGVGSAVLELARLRGLRAYGSANPSKFAQIEGLGAIPLNAAEWAAELTRKEPGGVDAAFDSFGGPSLEQSWNVLAPRGTLVSYGFSPTAGGGWAPMARGLLSLAAKNLSLTGRRARICGTPALCRSNTPWYRKTLTDLLVRAKNGGLNPRLHAVLPWNQAHEAHRMITNREARGKILLDFAPGS